MDRFNFTDVSDNEAIYNQLIQKLTCEAVERVQASPIKNYIIKVTDQNNLWVAGLGGYEFYGSLIIDIIWVDQHVRSQKIGTALLKCAEDHAFHNKLKMITVSTMEWWNALSFYQKNGFSIEFIREGFEHDFKQYHLKKMINHDFLCDKKI